MTAWDDINKHALSYECEYCGARPGNWCVTKSGRPSSWLHNDRTRPIQRATSNAYSEGKDDVLDAFDEATNWFSSMLDRRRNERAS